MSSHPVPYNSSPIGGGWGVGGDGRVDGSGHFGDDVVYRTGGGWGESYDALPDAWNWDRAYDDLLVHCDFLPTIGLDFAHTTVCVRLGPLTELRPCC